MARNQIIQTETKDGTINVLSVSAIKDLMDIYGVTNQKDCLERVLKLHNESLMEK